MTNAIVNAIAGFFIVLQSGIKREKTHKTL